MEAVKGVGQPGATASVVWLLAWPALFPSAVSRVVGPAVQHCDGEAFNGGPGLESLWVESHGGSARHPLMGWRSVLLATSCGQVSHLAAICSLGSAGSGVRV